MTISERQAVDDTSAEDSAAHLALLGHDLRSAVSDLVDGLRLLDLGRLDPDTRIQIERIRATGEALALMMDDGLAVLPGDRDVAKTASVRLSQLLHDAEMRWGGRAREKGLTFTVALCPDVPDMRLPDRVALERALANTLSNAMKYADGGSVQLAVGMAASGALRISVTDQGPGFSPDAMARIFDYGGRPEGAAQPGQGLGMHIMRRMSGRLGGTVIVENRPEGGARVTLELPPERWLAIGPADRPELPDLGDRKVLIVDDSATSRALLTGMLARMGAHCTSATDGTEARDILARERFDLVLIDIEMPGRSGLDVIGDLGELTIRPAVIAVTAHMQNAMRDRIRAAGADAVLAKPIADIATFGLAVAKVLAGDAAASDHGAASAPAADHPAPALQRLLQTAGPPLACDVLSHLCSDLRAVRHDLATGLADRLSPLVSAASHVLIALAGTVGADRLRTLAVELNRIAHQGLAHPTSPCGTEALALLDRLISHVDGERLRHEALS